MRAHLPLLAVLVVAAVSTGCAASPTVRAPEAPIVAPERIDRGPTSIESEIGGMNEEAVGRAFASLQGGVIDCVERRSAKIAAIGGHVTIRLRIDRQGAARWAYLAESTLGDRATERCVLDLARNKTWPQPVGGEGLAESSFDIDAKAAPAEWNGKRVAPIVASARTVTSTCRRGIAGSFAATVYVRPDGRVLAAGVAPPSEKAEGAADCVADAIRKLRFATSRARTTKVSFRID